MYLFHIPHSGLLLLEEFMKDYLIPTSELFNNMFEYADLFVNELYIKPCKKHGSVINPYSRLLFDPERFFDDNLEPMSKNGLGWFYEKTILDNKPLRSSVNKDKLAQYYKRHHEELELMVSQKLAKYGKCTIVDCHSFSNTKYWFQNDDINLPDICIGFDDFHKDQNLIDRIQEEFKEFNIEFNSPYSGSIVPIEHYQKNDKVKSVMIEINKKLYLKPNNRSKNEKEFKKIQDKLNKIFF